MKSLIPILGHNSLSRGQRERYQHIIDTLGHDSMYVDSGSVLQLQRANPVEVQMPFAILVDSPLSDEVRENWLAPVIAKFPELRRVEGEPDTIPVILEQHPQSFSLYEDVHAPDLVKQVSRLVCKHMGDPRLTVSMICTELGVSKYKLEQAFISAVRGGCNGHH